MKKAFNVKFPTEDEENEVAEPVDEEENPELEDDTVWENLDEEDAEHIDATLRTNSRHRISCFTHTIQLAVNDGLKEIRCVGKAIAKVTKLSTLLHKSTIFKEK